MNATMLVMMMFFSFLLLTPCLGFQQAYKGHDLTSDLAGIELSPNKVRITEAMHTIINTMNKVEKLPSCQKLASQALLNTCSEIDHATSLATDKGIDVMLERSKSIYATRLAICELMDANAVIPASCSPFRPVENDSKFNGFRGFIVNGYFTKPTTQHKLEDRGDLDQCSASLSSNPVWWTSYSNARQNAVLLCHSMRSELDKDDMMEKMRLMFEAILEASSVMSDTTEEHHAFQRQWTEMGKGMQSFHLALNTDREIQNRIMDQWAQFQAGVHDLGNNIQDLGRDVERVRQASSGITSDLEDHRLKAQTAHADVTKHLNQVLDVAIQIDRSHDNSLATSMALNQQNQDLAYTLARNAETARALHYQTEVLLEAIFTVTENVTDAARTVSEFQNDIQNLPTKVIQQVLAASIGGLPIGILAIVLLSLFWCFAFALLDTWGPFRARGSVVSSLGISIALTYLFFATPRISTAPTLSILGFVGFAIAAAFACKLWYKQQATCNQLADDFDQDDKPSVLLPQTTYDTEPLLS
ncbi:hypothetical protein D6D21_04848 [Aureobasidium pullulans]|uniref:Nuclear fusion protein KAR5 n=1 Tax=Aureobasidium pullulans TaxID=5580 RepID=A0AB74IZA5_AURPU|nr:hypothetical protein D6D21_04848 [Aureobasidium pullulans]